MILERYRNHFRELLNYRLANKKVEQNKFIIFGRGRSGSTSLVSLLDSVNNLHCDGEILNQYVPFPMQHVLAKTVNSGAPIYGCKILSYQVRDVQKVLRKNGFVKQLHDLGFKVLYLKRDNLIYHAVSNIRARKFGFHKKVSQNVNNQKVEIPVDELLWWIKHSEMLDKFEDVLLNNVSYLPLTYETHLQSAEKHQETAKLVCQFLGVECGNVKTKFRKVSPDSLHESVANYSEIFNELKNTKYAKYLD